jgi:sugar/nucleoside kinase (ribokinase family)
MAFRKGVSMKKRWDVVTVGQIYSDHVFSGLSKWPRPGEEIFTPHYLHELGGGGAITACGLGRLGRKTAVFGVIGEKEALWIKERLQDFNVETVGLREVVGSSGVTISVSVADERSFYSYAGSNALLDEYISSPEVFDQIHDALHVHFAAPIKRRIAERLLPSLKGEGCTVSLDLGWQPEWYLDPQNLETCREIDYFLPNGREAENLTGQRDPERLLEALQQLGFANVVVKLGGEGAASHVDGHMVQVGSPLVSVADTTGAGDAFDAGLIDAVLDGADRMEMMKRAAICGALSTRSVGAMNGLATRMDLEELNEKS